MKQKTIQEQYNLLQEGKWNEEVFMKHAKQQFPNYIRNAATLNETINSLKHQHLIFEGDLRMGRVITDNPTTQPDWFEIFKENMDMSVGDFEDKYGEYPTEIKNLIDAFMTARNSYNDLNKMSVDSTDMGNWRLYYDGKDTGLTYDGGRLSDETVMSYGLEHHFINEMKTREDYIAALQSEFGKNPLSFSNTLTNQQREKFWTLNRLRGYYSDLKTGGDMMQEYVNESEGDDEIAALEKEANKYNKKDVRYKEIQKKIGRLKSDKEYALPGSKADKRFSKSPQNESKAIEKKPTKEVVDMETKNYDYKDPKNIDNVFGEQFLTGYYCEMKDPKNSEKTIDEVKEIVSKNLAKDRLYYVKDGQFGVKGVGYTDELPGLKASKSDKMEPVKLKENKMISLVDLMESMPLGATPPPKPKKKKVKKETTDSKLSEIEKNGKIATLEMQIEALEEIISSKSERLSMISEDESLSELVDKKKMKEMQKEIKLLEKRKAGIEKLYEKMCGKSYTKKEIVDEIQNED